ncbi:hypothetical protein J0H58_08535 [bacterium]|nr:hypothetical protein [bacterium]
MSETTAPAGRVTRTTYDALGRVVKTVENYVDGVVSDADDKTTEYAYNAVGMTSLTARLTVVHAHERGTPAGREPIRWKLLTDLPVGDLAAAVEKLDGYALRWEIETDHKVLKSGCRAEPATLRTAERLTNLLAVLCVVGCRAFWLTMVNRTAPDAPPEIVLTAAEIAVLDRMATGTAPEAEASSPGTPEPPRAVPHYLRAIARLGGYLGRKNDPPPGNMVIWRGLTRLADILLGFELRTEVVGN